MVEDYPRLTPARIVSTLNDHHYIYLAGDAWYEVHLNSLDGENFDLQLGPISFLLLSEKGVEATKALARLEGHQRLAQVKQLLGTPMEYLIGLVDGFAGQAFDLEWGDYAIGFKDGTVAAALIEGIDPEEEAS